MAEAVYILCAVTSLTCSALLFRAYRNNGPRFDTQPWTGSTATPAGTMGLNFSDGNHGTLTYTYDGITVTKQIQRYAFGAVKPACD